MNKLFVAAVVAVALVVGGVGAYFLMEPKEGGSSALGTAGERSEFRDGEA